LGNRLTQSHLRFQENTMSCVAAPKLEYRCTRCFHSLCATADESGSEIPCKFCGETLVVPEATPERLARGEHFAEVLTPSLKLFQDDVPPTDAELARQVREQIGSSPYECLPNAANTSSRLKRLLGSIIDQVLLVASLFLGVALLMGLVNLGLVDEQSLDSNKIDLNCINAMAAIYLPLLALVLVQWNLIAVRGQSIGKMLCWMKIVTASGTNPGFVQGVMLRNWLRAALSMIPLFGLIDVLTIFGESRRCIHDFLAGTYVVDVY
jgi:uncharacterized RDD family membrane protein YckC/DNA-directed RNA polymerase subunit RPC12/RpoP